MVLIILGIYFPISTASAPGQAPSKMTAVTSYLPIALRLKSIIPGGVGACLLGLWLPLTGLLAPPPPSPPSPYWISSSTSSCPSLYLLDPVPRTFFLLSTWLATGFFSDLSTNINSLEKPCLRDSWVAQGMIMESHIGLPV